MLYEVITMTGVWGQIEEVGTLKIGGGKKEFEFTATEKCVEVPGYDHFLVGFFHQCMEVRITSYNVCYTKLLRNESKKLGHIPIIDRNPRNGEVIPMCPHKARRYNERSSSERLNSRLKDQFGGRNVMVRGPAKVMLHLMFGLVSLFADQLIKFRITSYNVCYTKLLRRSSKLSAL